MILFEQTRRSYLMTNYEKSSRHQSTTEVLSVATNEVS